MQQQPASLLYRGKEEIRLSGDRDTELPVRTEHTFALVLQQKVDVTLRFPSDRLCTGSARGGDGFLVPADGLCTLRSADDQPAGVLLVRFSAESDRPLPGDADDERTGAFVREGLHTFRAPDPAGWLRDKKSGREEEPAEPALFYQLQSRLYAIAACYLQSLQKRPAADLAEFVRYARQLMLDQYDHPLDIEELARSSGVGPSRFYKAFKERTGLSPHKYMTKIRMDASLRRLAGSPSTIVEVAHAVGYPDEFYFSRLFKRQMGLTPTEYAGCARKNIANLCGVFAGDLSVLGIVPQLSFERGWREKPQSVLSKLALAEPELILTGPLTDELRGQLESIAPVAELNWKAYSWKERLLDIGGRLGLATVAERWLSYYDGMAESARRSAQKHLSEEPFMLVHAREDKFYIFGMKRRKLRDVFYGDIQLTPPSQVFGIGMASAASLREIDAWGCRGIVFLVPTSAPPAYCGELERNWLSLDRTGTKRHCLFIRGYDASLYNPLVNEHLVEQMIEELLNRFGR